MQFLTPSARSAGRRRNSFMQAGMVLRSPTGCSQRLAAVSIESVGELNLKFQSVASFGFSFGTAPWLGASIAVGGAVASVALGKIVTSPSLTQARSRLTRISSSRYPGQDVQWARFCRTVGRPAGRVWSPVGRFVRSSRGRLAPRSLAVRSVGGGSGGVGPACVVGLASLVGWSPGVGSPRRWSVGGGRSAVASAVVSFSPRWSRLAGRSGSLGRRRALAVLA